MRFRAGLEDLCFRDGKVGTEDLRLREGKVGPDDLRLSDGLVLMDGTDGALKMGTENSLRSSAIGWIDEEGRGAEEVCLVRDDWGVASRDPMSSIMSSILMYLERVVDVSLEGFLLWIGRARLVPFSSLIYLHLSLTPPYGRFWYVGGGGFHGVFGS